MKNVLPLGDALLVTLVGIAIVFLGLVILICLIKVLVNLTENAGKPKAPKAPEKPAAAPATLSVVEETVEDDTELIAVITAAVAMMMEEGSAFTVRRVKRVSNAAAWSKAGREEQIYSRF